MTVNFSDLLSVDVATIEKPKPLPIGTYSALVLKYELGKTTGDRQAPYIKYFFKPLSAGADVDSEALAGVANWTDKMLNFTFYLDPESLYKLNNFVANTGLELVSGTKLESYLTDTVGKIVSISVMHALSKDGQDTYANIAKVMKAD